MIYCDGDVLRPRLHDRRYLAMQYLRTHGGDQRLCGVPASWLSIKVRGDEVADGYVHTLQDRTVIKSLIEYIPITPGADHEQGRGRNEISVLDCHNLDSYCTI